MKQLVFVYGTLLRGEANAGELVNAQYLGAHKTDAVFTMLDLGAYPAVVLGGDTAIAGEVFAVDAATLSRLDSFEDHPDEYSRIEIMTPFGEAWIYTYRTTPATAAVIVSGDWRHR
ncbi:MAG: gamma-glutamylcyclotransferase [Acidiferrobacterales bacterium]